MSSQDKFLSENIGKKIHIYTVDRFHLRGVLLLFDSFTLLIESPFKAGQQQLIYKSSIVAIENEA
jgi:RNA chaperone Hfq